MNCRERNPGSRLFPRCVPMLMIPCGRWIGLSDCMYELIAEPFR